MSEHNLSAREIAEKIASRVTPDESDEHKYIDSYLENYRRIFEGILRAEHESVTAATAQDGALRTQRIC